MAPRTCPRPATCQADVGERVPGSMLPAASGCLEDLAAIRRQVPAVQTCCSTTSGSIAAGNGPGSMGPLRVIPLAPTAPKALQPLRINLRAVKHPLLGSTTLGISGCLVDSPAAQTASMTFGSSIL